MVNNEIYISPIDNLTAIVFYENINSIHQKGRSLFDVNILCCNYHSSMACAYCFIYYFVVYFINFCIIAVVLNFK